jgi:hypothetical protein
LRNDENWRVSLKDFGRWLEPSEIELAQKVAPGEDGVALGAIALLLSERVARAPEDESVEVIALLKREAAVSTPHEPLCADDEKIFATLDLGSLD